MISICAWCKKDLGHKPPYEDFSTTHGICRACLDRYFPHYRGALPDYLSNL
ncbi:MAG: hypothetical protein ABSG91_19200 [Syntrophobacteraceae bacterium]